MRRFFDTNILVYSQDRSDPAKQVLAQSLVAGAIDGEELVVSTQVLTEFYVTVLRRKLLAPSPALALVKLWSENDWSPRRPSCCCTGSSFTRRTRCLYGMRWSFGPRSRRGATC